MHLYFHSHQYVSYLTHIHQASVRKQKKFESRSYMQNGGQGLEKATWVYAFL